MQNKTYDFTGTRCLIDYDGTIANSLGWYNEALDELYMGKVTDEHYIDHYHDFGDAYNLIPGCPWKTILADLCEFLSVSHIVSYIDTSDDNGQIRWLPQGHAYDIGKYDCLMKVTYDADFVEALDEVPAVLYEATNPAFDNFGQKYVIVIADCLTKELSEKLRDALSKRVNDDDSLTIFCDRYMSEAHPEKYATVYNTSTIFDNLHSRFEEAAVRALKSKSYEQLALEPVVAFLKTYRDAGGSILIHSGSNRIFIDTINEKLGITDLFDDILCSDMLSEADKASRANEWCGYKMVLFEKLMERNGAGDHDFVVGDTKGDGFAAYESSMPFFLIWRGYPKNPKILRRGEDDCITPSDWMDGRQERVDDSFASDDLGMFADDIDNMLAFAENIKADKIPAMTLFHDPQ